MFFILFSIYVNILTLIWTRVVFIIVTVSQRRVVVYKLVEVEVVKEKMRH